MDLERLVDFFVFMFVKFFTAIYYKKEKRGEKQNMGKKVFCVFERIFLLLYFVFSVSVVEGVRRYVTPDFIVEESEVQELVFRSGQCGDYENIPDMPVRAFMDYEGYVHILYDHIKNRQLKGDNLDDVQPQCSSSYQLRYSWVHSPWSDNGKDFWALVHREEYPGGDWIPCAAVDLVVSHDGGNTFSYVGPVASIDNCRPGEWLGFWEPSPIIMWAAPGFNPPCWCSILNSHHPDHDWQMFLMCSSNPWDPASWKVLTESEGWVSPLNMPWKKSALPWGTYHRTLSFNDYLGKYISLTWWDGTLYYSISDDLIHWSGGKKLLDRYIPDGRYPAFLQPGDPSDNFTKTSRSPYLYINFDRATYDRDILRIRIRFSKFEDDGKYELLELRMNERRGRKALDSSFYGNNGTLEGDCVWMKEGDRNFLHFSGSGRVVVPDSPSLDVSNEVTIEAEIRTTASGSCCPTIIRKEVEWTLRNYGLYISPSGCLHFSLNKPGGSGYSGSVSESKVNDGQWHEVMVVYNNSNGIAAYYIDKHLDALRYHGAKLEDGVNNAPARIGDLGFTGDINYVKVLNFAKVSKASLGKEVLKKYGTADTGMDVSSDKKVNTIDMAMVVR
jgi:hypothetical protein